MKTVTIEFDENQNRAYIHSTNFLFGKDDVIFYMCNIETIFGNLIAYIEDNLKMDRNNVAENIVNKVLVNAGLMKKGIEVQTETYKKLDIFCFEEIGAVFNDYSDYFDFTKNQVKLSIKELEKTRYKFNLFTALTPTVENHYQYRELHNISEVLFAILNYYALSDYKLKRCKHCKKWFATKSLKNEYCHRKSPLLNKIYKSNKGDEKTDCHSTVKAILKKIREQHKKNYDRLYKYSSFQEDFNNYINQYYDLSALANQQPTKENLTNLYNFVYSKRRAKK